MILERKKLDSQRDDVGIHIFDGNIESILSRAKHYWLTKMKLI